MSIQIFGYKEVGWSIEFSICLHGKSPFKILSCDVEADPEAFAYNLYDYLTLGGYSLDGYSVTRSTMSFSNGNGDREFKFVDLCDPCEAEVFVDFLYGYIGAE